MITTAHNPRTREAVRFLAKADQFNRLAKRAPRRHRRAFYERKDRAIERALRCGADQFQVDSIHRSPSLIVGITHLPSGRRLHLRPYVLSARTQVLLHGLAAASGHPYPLLKWADPNGSGPLSVHVNHMKEAP